MTLKTKMIAKSLLWPILLVLLGMATLIAFDVYAGAQTIPPTLPPVPVDGDPTSWFNTMIAALGAKSWIIAALLGIASLVWLAEHYGPKVWAALGNPLPSALLALAVSMILPVVNALAGGAPLTPTLVFAALTAGFMAWGGPQKLLSLIFPSSPAAKTVEGNPGVKL